MVPVRLKFRLPVAALLVAASLAVASAAAARDWTVQAGGSGAIATDRFAFDGGRGAFVGVSAPLRPWFLAGAEAAFYRLGPAGPGIVFAGSGWADAAASHMLTLAATVRLQVPVRSGPAPFATLESGVGRLRHGDVSGYGGWPPMPYLSRGQAEVVWTSAVGLGVRTVLPGAWPDVEAVVRHVSWGTRENTSFIEPRLALSF